MAELAWLKLHVEIRSDPKMRRLSDAEFRIWIMVMCLAAESSERGCLLLAPGVPLTFNDIALETNNSVESVEAAFLKFQDLKMVGLRAADQCFYLINFDKRQHRKPSDDPEAVNERVRRHRQNKTKSKKETPRCNADVTPLKRGCNATEAETDTETDTDKETDIYNGGGIKLDDLTELEGGEPPPPPPPDVKLVETFEKEFGRPLTPIEMEEVLYLGLTYGHDLTKEALRRSVTAGKLNLRYIHQGILKSWEGQGLKTLSQVQEYEAKRKKGHDPPGPGPKEDKYSGLYAI